MNKIIYILYTVVYIILYKYILVYIIIYLDYISDYILYMHTEGQGNTYENQASIITPRHYNTQFNENQALQIRR